MNIVKFNDIILTDVTGLSEDKLNLFNTELKGKYAYIINWMHIMPLNKLTQEEYVKLSLGDPLTDGTYIELVDIPQEYIDMDATIKANNVDSYIHYNKYTTDSNITLDEIKKFRPWLAYMLLQYPISDNDVKHMLEYYNFDDPSNMNGAGMYDDVIKQLSIFGRTDLVFDTVSNTCGCGGVGSLNTTTTQTYGLSINNKSYCDCTNGSNSISYNTSINTCDTVSIYRKNLYAKMVDTFKDIDFWIQYKDSILLDMINYIDNIININLPLYTSQYISNYVDCGCLNEKDLEQKTNTQILKNLKQSLQYIVNDEINTHKNFISDSLTNWASLLYERMYWA